MRSTLAQNDSNSYDGEKTCIYYIFHHPYVVWYYALSTSLFPYPKKNRCWVVCFFTHFYVAILFCYQITIAGFWVEKNIFECATKIKISLENNIKTYAKLYIDKIYWMWVQCICMWLQSVSFDICFQNSIINVWWRSR